MTPFLFNINNVSHMDICCQSLSTIFPFPFPFPLCGDLLCLFPKKTWVSKFCSPSSCCFSFWLSPFSFLLLLLFPPQVTPFISLFHNYFNLFLLVFSNQFSCPPGILKSTAQDLVFQVSFSIFLKIFFFFFSFFCESFLGTKHVWCGNWSVFSYIILLFFFFFL